MYNSHRSKGSDANFVRASFESGTQEIDDAIEGAIDVIVELTEQVDDKNEEIKELEDEIEVLEERLLIAEKPVNFDEEFLRVLRNISVYVADNIKTLEARCEQGKPEPDKQAEPVQD